MDDVSEAVRYVPRPRRLSCPGLFGLFWSAAALRTRAAKDTGDQLDRPPIPIPFCLYLLGLHTSHGCHVMFT